MVRAVTVAVVTVWMCYMAWGAHPLTVDRDFALLRIGGTPIAVAMSRTPEQIHRGLGGTPSLAYWHGMLFVWGSPTPQMMCMRQMRYGLDFVWIAQRQLGDRYVSGISRMISPEGGEMRTIPSPGPVVAVVEVPAGFCEAAGITTGMPVDWL